MSQVPLIVRISLDNRMKRLLLSHALDVEE